MVQTISAGGLVAHVEPMCGVGGLVLPPSLGVDFDAAAWSAAVRHLESIGWEPLLPDDGGPWDVLGWTSSGCSVVHLTAIESITSAPTLEEIAEGIAAVLEAAHADDI